MNWVSGWSRLSATLCFALAVLCCGALQADPTSIQEFLGRQGQWGELVGSRFQLEGRVETFGANDLRMRNLDLPFVFESPFERPRTMPYVVINGRLERDGRELKFLVTSLQDGKPESEMIREKLRLADTTDPATYDRVAAWTEARAKFYEDETLRAEARRLYETGVESALRRLKPDDSVGAVALAQKATRLGLSDDLRVQALHAASWAELAAEKQNRNPSYAAVLDHIRTRFPGADKPRDPIPAEVRHPYLSKPLDVYRSAKAEERPPLERLLYIEAVQRQAAAQLKSDRSNGLAVGRMLEQQVPEQPELAAHYQELELKSREERIRTLGSRGVDRQEVMNLRNDLRRLGQPERAQQVVKAWIADRFRDRPASPANDIDQAEHELEMAEDTERALELVSAAMRVDPQALGGAELLARMGYAWHEGRAVLKAHVPAKAPDPITMAMQEGRILPGMTAMQVRATLGGEPETIVRMASQEGVTELWHYAGQRLTISMESGSRSPDLKVARIVELQRSRADRRPRKGN